jgi:hypothetical protein
MYHIDMWEAKWIKRPSTEDIAEVPCAYGAFYVTNKAWYNTIHGWDYMHRIWGGLEQWLCLKSWLYGGQCHNIRDLETGHIFRKFMNEDPAKTVSNGHYEMYWYNKLFISLTILPLDEAMSLIEKVYKDKVKYELPTHQFNLGYKMIRDDWGKIKKIRDANQQAFVHDFDWFCEKFNIEKKF